jgi:hypothetical protein
VLHEVHIDFDRHDLASETAEECSLIARSAAKIEDALRPLELECTEHHGNDVDGRNDPSLAERNRLVVRGLRIDSGGKE